VNGDYKLVIAERDGVREERLTRLGAEEVDASSHAPEIAAALRAKLGAMREEMESGLPEIRQELSPEEREKLRALGYVSDP
jgi:hypothetical protein